MGAFFVWSLFISVVSSVVVKDVTLTPTNSDQYGAKLEMLKDTVTPTADAWHINVTDQIGWHMKLILDNSWGLHSTKFSSISVTINSSTNVTVNPVDLITTFAVSEAAEAFNPEFVTIVTRMGTSNNNKISPSCGSGNAVGGLPNVGDIEYIVDFPNESGYSTRYDASLLAPQQSNLAPRNLDTGVINTFPKVFVIENSPLMEYNIQMN